MGGISSFIGAIALLGFLAFLAGVGMVVVSASQGRPVRGGIMLAVFGLLFGMLLSIVSQGVIVVQPQEVAVVFQTFSGNLSETPLRSGTHIIVPIIQDATIYPINQQTYTMSGIAEEGQVTGDDGIVALSNDGQEIVVDLTVVFSINPEDADRVHERWQNNYIDGFIRPTVRTLVRDEVNEASAEEIYGGGRAELRVNAEAKITEAFAREGLILSSFLIRNITFKDEFANAIEQKQIEGQLRDRAETEAQRIEIEAKGRASAAIAAADGEAQSTILRAAGQAEALRLISQQLAANPLLIQYEYIRNLAPNINMALIPSNSPFLFDFGSLENLPAADPNFEAPIVPEVSTSTDD